MDIKQIVLNIVDKDEKLRNRLSDLGINLSDELYWCDTPEATNKRERIMLNQEIRKEIYTPMLTFSYAYTTIRNPNTTLYAIDKQTPALWGAFNTLKQWMAHPFYLEEVNETVRDYKSSGIKGTSALKTILTSLDEATIVRQVETARKKKEFVPKK